MSNRLYVTLEAVKRDWLPNLKDIRLIEDYDSRITELIRDVSKDIEEMCKPHTKLTPTYFIPVTETRVFDHAWDTAWLRLDQWLLSVSGFTTKNTETEVSASDYWLTQRGNYNEKPYNLIEMNPSGSVPALLYSGTPRRANSVTGQWGYCDDTKDTGATVQDDFVTIDATTMLAAAGTIEAGNMLLVGSEQIFAAAVEDGEPNETITIERHQNGTTAATHVKGTAISRYAPPADIVKLAGISVARLYHRGTTSFADTTGTPPGGLPYVAANVPDALAVINRYRREGWW